jgi:selenide,water dikinase
MAAASGVTLEFDAAALPLLDGALELAMGNQPGGGRTNDAHFGPGVAVAAGVTEPLRRVFFDPQTSGGLLVAVSRSAGPGLLAALVSAGIPAVPVGRVTASDPGVRVRLG